MRTIEDLRFRPARPEDAAGVAALLNACAVEETGAPGSTVESVLADWREPGRDPETDDLLAFDDDRIVGAVAVYPRGEDGIVRIDGYVHPEHRGRGIGTRLLDWAEARAADGGETILTHGVYAGAPGAGLLEARGYRRVRSFFEMTIDLDDGMPAAESPTGVVVRTVPESGIELQRAYAAVREAFEDHWGGLHESFETWAHRIADGRPDPDRSLWFLALDGDEIAGAVFAGEHGHTPDSGWIRYVAVRRPWRGRGVASALLRVAFLALRRRGFSRAGLMVDSENTTGATRLYERAGMRVLLHVDAYRTRVPR